MRRNLKRYRCYDCKHEMYIPAAHFIRASRPRCDRCGCSFLDEVEEQVEQKAEPRVIRKRRDITAVDSIDFDAGDDVAL